MFESDEVKLARDMANTLTEIRDWLRHIYRLMSIGGVVGIFLLAYMAFK